MLAKRPVWDRAWDWQFAVETPSGNRVVQFKDVESNKFVAIAVAERLRATDRLSN